MVYSCDSSGKSYYMVVTTNNLAWGSAAVTRQPTCEDDVAVIEVVPEEGCRFVRWSDGNADNPRQISYSGDGYAYRKAIFESTVGIGAVAEPADVNVYVSHGATVIEGAEGEAVSVFGMMGRLVLNCEIRNPKFEVRHSKLPAGIYLVKVGERKARKVALLGGRNRISPQRTKGGTRGAAARIHAGQRRGHTRGSGENAAGMHGWEGGGGEEGSGRLGFGWLLLGDVLGDGEDFAVVLEVGEEGVVEAVFGEGFAVADYDELHAGAGDGDIHAA